jgi:uncharacterized protein YndB with AHSA1/START domain
MDKVIHCATQLICTLWEAYDHFTRNDLLEAWLATTAQVEPQVGGNYELFWNPADRQNDSTIGCKVTAIDPPSFIAFEWKSPKQFKHFANSADPLTHVVVTFSPVGQYTRVNLIHSGWRNTPEWVEAAQWQEQAWTLAFKQLEGKINIS